uniref:Secreted protein n=1 Tax=Electrophorus electricus TaxID=8005 RepID=A0AAY5EPZ7_ELEEL
MRRAVRRYSAWHCSPLTSFSAASTTLFTMARLTGKGWEELTSASRILSITEFSLHHGAAKTCRNKTLQQTLQQLRGEQSNARPSPPHLPSPAGLF